jgi:hypothetical protein
VVLVKLELRIHHNLDELSRESAKPSLSLVMKILWMAGQAWGETLAGCDAGGQVAGNRMNTATA